MKMHILSFSLGLMVALGASTIGWYAIQSGSHIDIAIIMMAGVFLGFPMGYLFNEMGANDDGE